MICGLLALMCLTAYLAYMHNLNPAGSSFIHLNYIIPLAFACIALLVWRISAEKLKSIRRLGDADQKFQGYKKLQIMIYGVVEFSCLLALLAFLMTRELNYIIYALMILVYFIYIRPNTLKLNRDLELE
jgi:hypothetical protein